MDSSGRTTQRHYDVGRGRPDTNCRTLRGVRKVRGQDGEEARAVAGELQSKGGGKQETHTQHQVEECPLAEREPSGLIHTEPRPRGHQPQCG